MEPQSVNTHLSFAKDTLKSEIYMDGTTTIYTITSTETGDQLAVGKAKRRKGDPHIPDVGLALAAARAHDSMADNLYKATEVLLEQAVQRRKAERQPKSWKNVVTAQERRERSRKARLDYRLAKGIEQAKAGETVDRGDFTE